MKYLFCLRLKNIFLFSGSGWHGKQSTQMLHEHNNSSRLSLPHTGIPLASAVSSLCCACVCKLRPGRWWGDGECAGMRAEASLSLGVNGDRLVVETERFFTRWTSCTVSQPAHNRSAKTITPTPPGLTDIAAAEGRLRKTEGQGVSLPFSKDSSPPHRPTQATVWSSHEVKLSRLKQLLAHCYSREIWREINIYLYKNK